MRPSLGLVRSGTLPAEARLPHPPALQWRGPVSGRLSTRCRLQISRPHRTAPTPTHVTSDLCSSTVPSASNDGGDGVASPDNVGVDSTGAVAEPTRKKRGGIPVSYLKYTDPDFLLAPPEQLRKALAVSLAESRRPTRGIVTATGAAASVLQRLAEEGRLDAEGLHQRMVAVAEAVEKAGMVHDMPVLFTNARLAGPVEELEAALNEAWTGRHSAALQDLSTTAVVYLRHLESTGQHPALHQLEQQLRAVEAAALTHMPGPQMSPGGQDSVDAVVAPPAKTGKWQCPAAALRVRFIDPDFLLAPPERLCEAVAASLRENTVERPSVGSIYNAGKVAASALQRLAKEGRLDSEGLQERLAAVAEAERRVRTELEVRPLLTYALLSGPVEELEAALHEDWQRRHRALVPKRAAATAALLRHLVSTGQHPATHQLQRQLEAVEAAAVRHMPSRAAAGGAADAAAEKKKRARAHNVSHEFLVQPPEQLRTALTAQLREHYSNCTSVVTRLGTVAKALQGLADQGLLDAERLAQQLEAVQSVKQGTRFWPMARSVLTAELLAGPVEELEGVLIREWRGKYQTSIQDISSTAVEYLRHLVSAGQHPAPHQLQRQLEAVEAAAVRHLVSRAKMVRMEQLLSEDVPVERVEAALLNAWRGFTAAHIGRLVSASEETLLTAYISDFIDRPFLESRLKAVADVKQTLMAEAYAAGHIGRNSGGKGKPIDLTGECAYATAWLVLQPPEMVVKAMCDTLAARRRPSSSRIAPMHTVRVKVVAQRVYDAGALDAAQLQALHQALKAFLEDRRAVQRAQKAQKRQQGPQPVA